MEKLGETIFRTLNTGIFRGVGKGITEDFSFSAIHICISSELLNHNNTFLLYYIRIV